jgi:hypothetical protein
LFDFAFLEDFFDAFLGAFFTAVVFFAVFLAVFLAFFAPRLLVLARGFRAALAPCRALRTFFALRFLTVFFLAVATTISFIAQNKIVGDDRQRSA